MKAKHWPPLLTFLVLLGVYGFTLAPGATLWDSGEFLAAIKTLGIPHPAGTPFYILLAKCWSFLFAPIFGFARSVNLFSAVATAAACAMVANLFAKWTGKAAVGICAGILSGAMTTVWSSATETEVYALALLLGVVILFTADRCGATGEARWGYLTAYLCGLALSLHLSTLVVVPSAALLAFSDRDGVFGLPGGRRRSDGRRALQSPLTLAVGGLVLFAIGATCIAFLLVRAKHDPAINQGNPSTLSSLWDVVTRKQYGARSLWPRSAPLYLQIGNLFEYADWQLALGFSSAPGPSWVRTGITLIFAVLGVAGSIEHRRVNVRSWRAWTTLLVVGSIVVVLYLNMKTGPSFGHGLVPDGNHEARERDYFFFFAFAAWAAWAALGAVRVTRRWPPSLASAPFIVAVLPIVFNWSAMDRSNRGGEPAGRGLALALVRDLPPNAVMFSIGDNDTYPIWYLQQVEGVRRDVTVVTIPLLSAAWYRAELARRYQLLSPDDASAWKGSDYEVREISDRASHLERPVVQSGLAELMTAQKVSH